MVVLERGEIPNHCHQTPDKDLPGRGQAVKAAVWNDIYFLRLFIIVFFFDLSRPSPYGTLRAVKRPKTAVCF